MIVAAVLYSYPPHRHAGADIYNAHQLEALAAAGHEVRVFTTQKAPAYVRYGVIVHGSARDYPRTVDIVWTAPDAGPMGRVLAQRKQAKLVGVVHNVHPATTAALQRGWDFIVFNAESTQVPAPSRYGSLVVRPPVYVPDPPTAYAHYGDAVTLINLSADKGAETWWRLAERNPDTPFLGVLSWGVQMTAHPDGAYCPNVSIMPTVPHEHMGDVWARTGVLLCPSKSEAWGMAAVEALAHGIPVIAHPTPGLRESLGGAGVFVDRADVDRWDASIGDVLPKVVEKVPSTKTGFGRMTWISDPKLDRDALRGHAQELATLTANDTRALVAALEGLA